MNRFDVLYIATDNNAMSLEGLKALRESGRHILVVLYEPPHLRFDPKQPEELYIKPSNIAKHEVENCSSSLYCHRERIPYILTHETDLQPLFEVFAGFEFDFVLINGWSAMIDISIRQFAKIETMNCHPSLLPEYRGGNITYAPLINGDKQSGITVHVLTEKFDAGPIISQCSFPLEKTENKKSLEKKRADHVAVPLLNALEVVGNLSAYKENPHSEFWYKQSYRSYIAYRILNHLRSMLGKPKLVRGPKPQRFIDHI